MAEAFGIAGSAFGTVSLGLQLFKEISQYLDDINGREEDLKEARNYATNIQLSLNALDVAIFNAPTGDATTKNAIDSCKASCISAVNNLLAVVTELKGARTTLPNSNATRAKELCAKLKYPFKKQNIQKLEEILSRTNSALQTVLQVFQLNIGHTTTSALNSMHQAVVNLNAIWERNTTALDEIHKTSQLHDERLTNIQQDVRELLILARNSDDSKLLLRSMAQQVPDPASCTTMATNLLQNPQSEAFMPSIQTTSYQGGGRMTFNAFCTCKTQRVRYSQRHWGPFLVEAEVRSRDHHAPECPMSKFQSITRRTKRVFSLLVPTSQSSWGRASRISLSFTTGASILGFGQTVAWIAIVDGSSSPVFRLVDTISRYVRLPRKEMHMLLSSCFRRLIWCYTNSRASVTDVNQGGETILGCALRQYSLYGDRNNADNIAELFQMLTIIADPISCTRQITAIPTPFLIAASEWFRICTRPDQVATAILSKCDESVGHHHRRLFRLKWNWHNLDFNNGDRLFPSFQLAAENLEFGPVSLAVLKQDLNGVQQLLERCPSHIKEVNYCGQSPVHLAIEIQSVDLINVVLHYADAEALRARDNMGFCPIDYVTNGTWRDAKEDQEDCKRCKILELLIRSHQALFPTSLRAALRPSLHGTHSCIQGRKIIIKALAERREELKELSYRRLSPAEKKGLEIHPTRILDQNTAERIQRQLEAQGCPVPAYLRVYEEDIESPNEYESIYSLISTGEVAEYAHQMGFYFSDNTFADFICHLAFDVSREKTYGHAWDNYLFSSSYLCWMIDHGASVSARIPAGQLPNPEIEVTTVHYFMASLGISVFGSDSQNLTLDCPLSPAALRMVFSETIVDRCRCWCSPAGCTPLVKLLEGISGLSGCPYPSQHGFPGPAENVIKVLFSEHWDRVNDFKWIYAAIIRHQTFVRLGLRHVCCSIVQNASGPLPEEEFHEIGEEDSSLLGLFESLLTEFEDGCRHEMSLAEFFEWMRMKWDLRMEEVEEELASQKLTDEQVRDAELVGVVWEAYGPQPIGESSGRCDVREHDLWDAMDQLDLIATDPERPTKENLQTYD